MTNAVQQVNQLRPLRGIVREKTRRLREDSYEQNRQCERQNAPDDVKSSPTESGQDPNGHCTAQHAAQRYAHNGEFDCQRTASQRSKFSNVRSNIWKRATHSHPGKQTQNSKSEYTMHKSGEQGEDAKQGYKTD